MMSISGSIMVRSPGTLFGVAKAALNETADVSILGIPFDMGNHPNRVGSRSGPAHVRHHSLLVGEQSEGLGFPPLEVLRVVDTGDLDVTPGQVDDAYSKIELAVTTILESGAMPITIGGDGSVTLPQLRAAGKIFPGLVVLHFDAHTDTYAVESTHQFNNANAFLVAAQEGAVDPRASFHIGVRGTEVAGEPGWLELARELGYQVVTVDECLSRSAEFFSGEIYETLKGKPVYVCWDMDVFDPSAAPGVVTPSWGGFSAREGLDLIRGLEGLEIVAVDLNTVSPPHDVGGATGSLASAVLMEFLRIKTARHIRDMKE